MHKTTPVNSKTSIPYTNIDTIEHVVVTGVCYVWLAFVFSVEQQGQCVFWRSRKACRDTVLWCSRVFFLLSFLFTTTPSPQAKEVQPWIRKRPLAIAYVYTRWPFLYECLIFVVTEIYIPLNRTLTHSRESCSAVRREIITWIETLQKSRNILDHPLPNSCYIFTVIMFNVNGYYRGQMYSNYRLW